MIGAGIGFQARCEIDAVPDGCIVQAIVRTKISNRTRIGMNANANVEGLRDPFVSPCLTDFSECLFHFDGHTHTVERVFFCAIGFGIPEENHDRVSDVFIDGSTMFDCDIGHFG